VQLEFQLGAHLFPVCCRLPIMVHCMQRRDVVVWVIIFF